MKLFLFALSLLVCTLNAATPFAPGGVAVDWSKYAPKPQKEIKSSINFVRNGSFEEQTDFKGSRGKGFWTAGSRAHGLKNTPANQAFKQRFSQAVIRRIRKDGAAEGKAFLFLKTPDEVKDWLKPFPQISNRLGQTVPVTVEKEGFYGTQCIGVPVFENVISVQGTNLQAIPNIVPIPPYFDSVVNESGASRL